MKAQMFSGMSAVVYCGSRGDWPLLTDSQRGSCEAQFKLFNKWYAQWGKIHGTVQIQAA